MHSAVSSLVTLSFGWTKRFLIVVWGLVAVEMTLFVHSSYSLRNSSAYGITTVSYGLDLGLGFFFSLVCSFWSSIFDLALLMVQRYGFLYLCFLCFAILFLSNRISHISPVLRQLHWLPIRQRIQYKAAVLVHKCRHAAAPPYLVDFCVPASSFCSRYQLRSPAAVNRRWSTVRPADTDKLLWQKFCCMRPDSLEQSAC